MGKDREGVFHPRKGKPSGLGKVKASELQVDVDHIEENFSIAEKYTTDNEDVASNVRVRHPNRNVDKGEEVQKTKRENNTANKSNDLVGEEAENINTTVPEELPGILSKEVFSTLANYSATCCISIYIPTDKSNAAVVVNDQTNIINFKNALQKSSELIRQKGFDPATIDKMLEPGYELLRDDAFWNKLSNGLAVFIADGFFKYIKMPVSPTEEVFVNKSFFVSPLIPILTSKEHFFLLVISKKQAKLFRGDAFGMEHVPISEMPNGVDDVVHFEEKEDQKLFRTGSSGDGAGANYHGIGAGKPDEKTHVAIYLEEVDDTIWKEVLHNENAPLLLAGVEYLIPIYKQVSDYNNIWYDAITGNHQNDDTNSLYQKAKEKLEPYFKERTSKALATFANHSATPLTSSNPEEVIPAAHYARVSQLFVQKDEHIWGKFDELNNVLSVHETQEPDDECLINRAVTKTLLNGGEVYILEKEKMPADSKISALMRYDMSPTT